MNKNPQIAQHYGRILFDVEHKEKMVQDVTRLHQALTQAGTEWRYLANPALPIHVQERVLEQLGAALKLDKMLINFLRVVCQNRRLRELESMLQTFYVCHHEAHGKIEGVVESAKPLTSEDLKILERDLKKWFKKEVHLREEIRHDILGGIIVQVGSLRVDASLKTRLTELKKAMKGEGR